MPDDSDYSAFFGLLARPESWTDDDVRLVEFSLREQREQLEAGHLKDTKRRDSLSKIVDQIEAALVRYRSRRDV